MLTGREVWRPLALSIQQEYVHLFGLQPLSDAADFLLAAYPIEPSMRAQVPAVVHVDGSARPQIVRRETHLRFWKLLEAFREQTGIPALINTSFNLAGEPLVYRPQDVVDTFQRSQLDVLVLDDYLLEKPDSVDNVFLFCI